MKRILSIISPGELKKHEEKLLELMNLMSGNDVRAMQVAVILGDGEKEDAGKVVRYTWDMDTEDRAKVIHWFTEDYMTEVAAEAFERLAEEEGEDEQEEAT